MSVVVNDKPVDIPAGSSVSDLFPALSLSPQGFAVAVNGQIVPRTQWADTPVNEGDQISLFQAIAGG
ncbi:sulfur carrier protein ThiS [Parasalinivibrio latis]|uniref:sulfur carrier protein ThiS n=1 Tax=Parasalinivibrio latis TaxID=2952610 RepID=UPI0030E26F7C